MQRTRRTRCSLRCSTVTVVLLTCLICAEPVGAQTPPASATRISRYDVGKIYRSQRFQHVVEEILAERGFRVYSLPAAHLPSLSDTLLTWLRTFYPDYVEAGPPPRKLTVESWQLIKRTEWLAYQKQFDRVKWAYIGNTFFTPLDTTSTREIRARMQAHFGAPTKTLAELDWTRNLRSEEYIQFEYWFVVNDTIPMVVMDGNGPFDRGVVVASDHHFREDLFDLRQAFLTRIMEDGRFAPYVDYYYNYRARRWYRVGFDGRHFFTDPIGQPNLARGRPRLPSDGG